MKNSLMFFRKLLRVYRNLSEKHFGGTRTEMDRYDGKWKLIDTHIHNNSR